MEKTVDHIDEEPIDLGVASIETKGPGFGGQDSGGLRNTPIGICED